MPKPKVRLRFLQKPTCTTCRKAKAFLEKCGAELDSRDLGKERLSAEEIDALIGDRDYKPFLNTRNELYRQKKMAKNPPSRAEAIRLDGERAELNSASRGNPRKAHRARIR